MTAVVILLPTRTAQAGFAVDLPTFQPHDARDRTKVAQFVNDILYDGQLEPLVGSMRGSKQ